MPKLTKLAGKSDGLISSMTKFDQPTEKDKMQNKIAEEIPLEKYFEWYHDSYTKQVPTIKLKTDYNAGMMKRVNNISSLKFGILPNMLQSTTVVFKLHDYNSRKEVNYANVFCENINDIPAYLRKQIGIDRIIGNVVLQYYSTSSSLISCDGEYRTKFSSYYDLLSAKVRYPEIWNEIDRYVSIIQKKRSWSIYPSYFHGKESSDNFDIEKVIKSDLLANVMLAVTWFHTIYNELLGLTETHMNETFREIFFAEMSLDLEFMKELIKKYSAETVDIFRVEVSHLVHPIFGSKAIRYIPLGYKMIPLNMREIQDPLRLKYKPWKEVMICNKINDLIINQVAPGFPITLDWFLIKNSSKGLFDNKSQYERLKHSELARDILHTLYEAQRSTYFATSDLGKTAKTSEHVKQWISSKFKRLSDKIADPINYSIEEIIFSDVTLAFPSEFVGRTIADTVNLVSSSKIYDLQIGKPFSTDGYNMFAKYIFEICYGLLTINKRLGIIHGDFHLNNATIGFLYKVDKPNAKVIYDIDDNKYIFDNNGYFSCIIDFSRGIVNPEMYREITNITSDIFKPVKDFDKFAAGESYNLLNLYLMLFPNKAKQKDELNLLFKNNFQAVFKLMTAIDLYMFSVRMIALLSQTTYPVGKKCVPLMETINKLSETFITSEINHLLADEAYATKILAEPYPIETIIKKCFSEYISGGVFKDIGVIIDYYKLNNELISSLSRYELFPQVLKEARYYTDKSNTESKQIEFFTNSRKTRRLEYEQQKIHNLEHVKFMALKLSEVM